MENEKEFVKQFSQKLKNLRKEKGLEPEQVSQPCKISSEDYMDYEEGKKPPVISDVLNISRLLGVPNGYFFSAKIDEARVEVVRASERWDVKRPTDPASALNYSYEALSYNMRDKMMLPFIVNIPVSPDKKPTPSTHAGEEFLYVLEGSIEIIIGESPYQLDKGDSVYFDSRVEHTIFSKDNQPAKLLAFLVNTEQIKTDENPMMRLT